MGSLKENKDSIRGACCPTFKGCRREPLQQGEAPYLNLASRTMVLLCNHAASSCVCLLEAYMGSKEGDATQPETPSTGVLFPR